MLLGTCCGGHEIEAINVEPRKTRRWKTHFKALETVGKKIQKLQWVSKTKICLESCEINRGDDRFQNGKAAGHPKM
ncbi:hypothetical protein ACFX13_009632 [Malus domestica]